MTIRTRVVVQDLKRNVKRNNLHFLKLYNQICKITIYLILLVICAGGFVRMTGSGMGCPDWPKCFGSWIPPTSVSQLPDNYKEIYSDRGYDTLNFNVFNTWIEYINRLLGLVSGLFCLALFLVSLKLKNKTIFLLSSFLVFLMGFQAWMGALVVYSILAPFKITIHMLIALFIVSLLLLLYRLTSHKINNSIINHYTWILIALIISLIQIILGTQVRESVDMLLSEHSRFDIVDKLPMVFEAHRTMAWLVVISNIFLIYHYRILLKIYFELKTIVVIVISLIFTGLLMSYHGIHGLYQLLHLLLAVSLFLCQFSILLKQFNFSRLDFP